MRNSTPAVGIADREITLFRNMVKLRHLWKWLVAGTPANANLNYLAWNRAARVTSGLPANGIHSSFFVPVGTNANAYFVLLLENIATVATNAVNVSVAYNGALVSGPVALAGVNLNTHTAPGGGNYIVQIFVNIAGAAQIGGAVIQGIKCNLTAGNILPVTLAPVGGIPAGPLPANVLNAIEAGSSIREALYTNAHVGAVPVAEAFMQLHEAAATATIPQNINVVEIRITQPAGGVSVSMCPI
ncbi:MAG: hypothetical protein LBU35_00460 [Holosporales bacterium]|nr:hypothetical protein [Holosporales bacterium]